MRVYVTNIDLWHTLGLGIYFAKNWFKNYLFHIKELNNCFRHSMKMYFIIKMQQECFLKNILRNLIIYDILKSQHLNKLLH